jgi:hypothetical protein
MPERRTEDDIETDKGEADRDDGQEEVLQDTIESL